MGWVERAEFWKRNPSIKELANRPLLLTLLCLEFEDSGDFPSDLAELYKRAINTLHRLVHNYQLAEPKITRRDRALSIESIKLFSESNK